MSVKPRAFILRGLAAFALFGCVTGLALHTHRFFENRFENQTGKAQWIWQEHRLSSRDPVAFYATRAFTLPEQREFVRIKVAASPAYTLYFNGREIGGGARRDVTLDVFDVTQYAQTGTNRIVASVRSGDGVGGFLAAVDLGPTLMNAVVTDESWNIFPGWHDEIAIRNPRGVAPEPPLVLGEPPFGAWDYPPSADGKTYGDARFIGYPVSRTKIESALPEIRTAGGVVIATLRPAQATVFDFGGMVYGRPRIETAPGDTRLVRVRYLPALESLDPAAATESLVLGAGESSVIDPEPRHFRYAVVYATDADATLVTETPRG